MVKVAKIILLNKENKFLLTLRDNNPNIPEPNYWSLVGGHLEEGETPLQALKRELKEELSCPITGIKFIGETYDARFGGIELLVFKGIVDEEIKNIKVYEGQKAEFFDLENLKSIKFTRIFLDFILSNKEKIFEE